MDNSFSTSVAFPSLNFVIDTLAFSSLFLHKNKYGDSGMKNVSTTCITVQIPHNRFNVTYSTIEPTT